MTFPKFFILLYRIIRSVLLNNCWEGKLIMKFLFSISKYNYGNLLLLVVILLTLTTFRILWLSINIPINQPTIHNDVLDLRDYDLTIDNPIVLNQEIDFIPNQLTLNPNLFKPTINHPVTINKPSQEVYYGTYYLKIKLRDSFLNDELMSIRMPSSFTASSLYVNGTLVGKSGVVSNLPSTHKGEGTPYIATFPVTSNELDIIIHISNFDNIHKAQLGSPIILGSVEKVYAKQNLEEMLVIAMVVILALHSMYSFLIFIFISRNLIFLIFGLGFLFPALDELFTYSANYLDFLDLSYNHNYQLKLFIYLGAAFFFVLLLKSLLPTDRTYRRFKVFYFLYLVATISILILPINYIIQFEYLLYILYFSSFIGVMPLAMNEFFKTKKEAFFIAVVIIGTSSGIIWGLIKSVINLTIPFYPFDYLVAFLSFATFWFSRFYNQSHQVNQLVKELELADKQKDEYLALTSHELRNPLHGIMNITQTILDDQNEVIPSKSRENLELLLQVSNRMNFIINDLQDFTRLKEKRIILKKEAINLTTVIQAVVDMLKFMTDGKKIAFTIKIPEESSIVLADKNRIVQVLFNLLHNAIKFTKEGEIIIWTYKQKDHVAVAIKDTGIGIDIDLQSKIFSSYEQLDAEKSFQQGMGLGLSICKNLVELHGGVLSVESVPTHGSTFTFTLPVGNIRSENSKITSDQKVIKIKNDTTVSGELINSKSLSDCSPRILIVDDDPINLKILQELLANDYIVHTVDTPKKVFPLLHHYDWDLIITDIMLSEMSGYELTQKIREKFTLSELPILLLTARQSSQDIYTGFLSGANDYIAKPVVALELKSRVKVLTLLKSTVKEQLQMESQLLHAQIQPHFLFNTLNVIASLSTLDIKRMSKLLDEFANYLRKSFNAFSTAELIEFKEELSLVESYLYIEKERFGNKLNVIWDIEENLNFVIPPFSVQTIVENAVRHGLLPKVEGGTITISAFNYGNFVNIEVVDNGVGIKTEQLTDIFEEKNTVKNGIGLINTHRRLMQHTGEGLSIDSVENQYTVVSFKIPH